MSATGNAATDIDGLKAQPGGASESAVYPLTEGGAALQASVAPPMALGAHVPLPDNLTMANIAAGVAAARAGILTAGEFTLPSGKVAKVRPGKGRDILRASRTVDPQKDGPMAIVMAVAALKTEIDGRPVTFEDFLDLDDADCWELINRSQAGKASSPPITSQG